QNFMLRALDDDHSGHAEARSEPPGRESIGHSIRAGRDNQYGRQRHSREAGMIEATHMAKRRMSPTDGRGAQSKFGTCGDELRDASKPCFVRGENVSLE